MHRAKKQIQKHLSSGKSLIWFPEGTWNLTNNLLMLPMKWGIIDCAQKCNVSIIPVILEYKAKNICLVNMGEPLNFDGFSLREGIDKLRDQMATIRWISWEQKGVSARKNLDLFKERQKILQAVNDYPPLDLEYEQSVVFNPLSTRKLSS